MTLLGFDAGTRSTYFKWKKNPDSARLSRDKLERLSYVFGIYKALQLYAQPGRRRRLAAPAR